MIASRAGRWAIRSKMAGYGPPIGGNGANGGNDDTCFTRSSRFSGSAWSQLKDWRGFDGACMWLARTPPREVRPDTSMFFMVVLVFYRDVVQA